MFKDNVVILISFIMLTVLLTSCGNGELSVGDELYVPQEHSYKTQILEMGEYSDTQKTQADIVFTNDRELFYDEEVYFKEYYVENEQNVYKGDVIASFYTNDSTVPLEEKRLEIKQAQTEVAVLNSSYSSQLRTSTELLNTMSVNGDDYVIHSLKMEKSRLEHEQSIFMLESRIHSLTKELADMEAELTEHSLLAPFDGVVVNLANLEEGDIINPTVFIARLVDIENFVVRVKNPEGFRYNDTVTITVSNRGDDIILTGTVISSATILPGEFREEGSYIQVESSQISSSFPDSSLIDLWKRNMSISVTTVSEYIPNVLLLNRGDVFVEGEDRFVNVLEDDIVKKRYFESIFDNTEYYAVTDGLTEGQQILMD